MRQGTFVRVLLFIALASWIIYSLLVTRYNEISIEHEPVDVVISWVNGSDPVQKALYGRHDGRGTQRARQRWRDWDELRYCLRSIESYAPWANHIYIVVNNDSPEFLPAWLNTSHSRLTVVSVRDLFKDPRKQFPTANSNAVEVNLHRIKGLSRRFIYMNNDWFFRKPVKKSLFFIDKDRQWVFPSVLSVNGANQPQPTDGPREKALLRNARLLDQHFGDNPSRAADLHAPMPIDRLLLREMAENTFLHAFSTTSYNIHRSEDDVILPFFYSQYALSRGKALARERLAWGTFKTLQFGLQDSLWRNRAFMLLVMFADPVVLCVNDDVSDEMRVPAIQREATIFFEFHWPLPSTFELVPPSSIGR